MASSWALHRQSKITWGNRVLARCQEPQPTMQACLESREEEYYKLEANLDYMVSSSTARATIEDSHLPTHTKKNPNYIKTAWGRGMVHQAIGKQREVGELCVGRAGGAVRRRGHFI